MNKFSDDNMPKKGNLIVLTVVDDQFGIASYERMKIDPIVIVKYYLDDVLWYPIPQLCTASQEIHSVNSIRESARDLNTFRLHHAVVIICHYLSSLIALIIGI